jgi:hypothetical protein
VELLRGKPERAIRTEISEHFDRSRAKAQPDSAFDILQSKRMTRRLKRETGGGDVAVGQRLRDLICSDRWPLREVERLLSE